MWEFEIKNKETKEINIIFGYSYDDALKRNSYKQGDWILLNCYFID